MGVGRIARWVLAALLGAGTLALVSVGAATVGALGGEAVALPSFSGLEAHPRVLDRNGRILRNTYRNHWNMHDRLPLEQIPERLIEAVLHAEDKRFFEHAGQDWRARISAMADNLLAGRVVRGASTISEQVVRLVQPRPRTFWSRWLEGWQAARLERVNGKRAILEFYLNQVPYGSNRRGVAQAAKLYFDREVRTLSVRELLALAVLIRAPSRFDPRAGDEGGLRRRMQILGSRLGWEAEMGDIGQPLELASNSLKLDAAHFLRHVLRQEGHSVSVLRTTLDGELQKRTQLVLDQSLRDLARRGANHAAALVANHATGEVLAWVVAQTEPGAHGSHFDTVQTRRQPGSTLKPFLYGLAMQQGWTSDTMITDEPIEEASPRGLHAYRNYSDRFYGPVSLRDALGNSLNIPAVKTVQFVGVPNFLRALQVLGFRSLEREPSEYGSGLALGNGEVSLLELVTAYGALGNRGIYRGFRILENRPPKWGERRVFSPEIASAIADILSNDAARQLEFPGGLLDFPVQTAVKTGTSSDFRDAWAVGFDSRFVAGVWMGSLDGSRMDGVTGAQGPLLVLRSTLDALNEHLPSRRLWLSPRLAVADACLRNSRSPERTSAEDCMGQRALAPRAATEHFPNSEGPFEAPDIAIARPTPGLQMAIDPRIPREHQRFEFKIRGVSESDSVEWIVNREIVASQNGPSFLWPLAEGKHVVSARVSQGEGLIEETAPVEFVVW